MNAQGNGNRRRLATLAAGAALLLAAALPASAPAAGLVAAYDRYETGKGFEIGLANASTGTKLTVPAGVNTAADELHPALSVDGRYMLFERMQLLPKLNGDIVPPAERTVLMLDRQTGIITTLATGNGAPAGPTFANRASRTVTWGVAPHSTTCCILKFQAVSSDNTIAGSTGFPLGFLPPPAGQLLDGTHAAMDSIPLTNIYVSWISSDANTGAQLNAGTTMVGLREGGQLRADFGSADTPVTHPAPRRGDRYVAVDRTSGGDADIQTISFPAETSLTPAPAPITTAAPERMPAWSPGGLQLAFVRTTDGRRKLAIFDLTPGLQTIVNPPIDIGADAPSPQTRAFQSGWGGLSLAESSALDIPVVTCTTSCLQSLQTSLTEVAAAARRVHDDQDPDDRDLRRTRDRQAQAARPHGPEDQAGRPRPSGQDPQGAQPVPLEREGERTPAEAGDLPAHLPGAPARAGGEHVRLRPLHRDEERADPRSEAPALTRHSASDVHS